MGVGLVYRGSDRGESKALGGEQIIGNWALNLHFLASCLSASMGGGGLRSIISSMSVEEEEDDHVDICRCYVSAVYEAATD